MGKKGLSAWICRSAEGNRCHVIGLGYSLLWPLPFSSGAATTRQTSWLCFCTAGRVPWQYAPGEKVVEAQQGTSLIDEGSGGDCAPEAKRSGGPALTFCDPDGKQALLVQGPGTLGRDPRPPSFKATVRLPSVLCGSCGSGNAWPANPLWSGLGLAASWEARNGVCRWPGNLFRQGFQRQSGLAQQLNSVVRLGSEHSPTPLLSSLINKSSSCFFPCDDLDALFCCPI